jgi:sulfite reductase (NADPH) flavoprotein alpha-component
MNDGAYLYLCGDKKKMAVDVEKTLLEIISKQGGMTSEKAKEYLHRLKKEKRYLTDVY